MTALGAVGRDDRTADGRGAKNKNGAAPHLVAALAHGIGAVPGQVAADAKSNEIPAVRELLKAFADLAGAVLTIDALHTQHDTARAILARHADYVMTVKGSQPGLRAQLAALPWRDVPVTSDTRERGHGRHERRTLQVTAVAAGLRFPHAARAIRIVRRRRALTSRKWSAETIYAVTSLTPGQARPDQLAAALRGHREIEDRLHWVRSPGAGLAVASCGAGATRVSFSC